METRFTPGPWSFSRWEQWGDTRFYIAQADNATYTPNYSDVATLIAETVSGERVAIQEANARLIAAAPDLLAALQRCRFDSLNMSLEDLQFCRAAIAKATGEQA